MSFLKTSYIHHDEPCWGYFELNFQSPNNHGFRRYQIIEVVRNGQIAEYRKDLGPAKKFKYDQLRIPCYLVHKVGEAMEIAEWMKAHSRYDKADLAQVNIGC